MVKLTKNIKFLLIATGIVLVWRGVWGLADIYLIPDNPALSFIVSIIIGVLILLLINWRKVDISELSGE